MKDREKETFNNILFKGVKTTSMYKNSMYGVLEILSSNLLKKVEITKYVNLVLKF